MIACIISTALVLGFSGCRNKTEGTTELPALSSASDTVNPLTDNMCGGYLDGYDTFEVTSADLNDGVWDDIISNTDIGENKSPQLSWEPVEGAEVYAVYMFDTNTNGYLHWRSGGITETSLPEGWASPLDYNGPHIGHGYTHNFDIYVIALKAPRDYPVQVHIWRCPEQSVSVTFYRDVCTVQQSLFRHHGIVVLVSMYHDCPFDKIIFEFCRTQATLPTTISA